jgi:hypothetical protein
MWAKADPSAGEMREGTGAAGEECSGKARMQGARFRPLLERQSSHLKNNNIVQAFNQQIYLLALISTQGESPLLHSRRKKTKPKHPTNRAFF